MNTQAVTVSKSGSDLGTALFAGLVGAALIFVIGVAQPDVLHDAAHDLRHATGFPCH